MNRSSATATEVTIMRIASSRRFGPPDSAFPLTLARLLKLIPGLSTLSGGPPDVGGHRGAHLAESDEGGWQDKDWSCFTDIDRG